MRKGFKNTIAAVALPFVLFAMSSCAMIGGIDNEGDTRRVDGVMWHNQTDTDINDVLKKKWLVTKPAWCLFEKMMTTLSKPVPISR